MKSLSRSMESLLRIAKKFDEAFLLNKVEKTDHVVLAELEYFESKWSNIEAKVDFTNEEKAQKKLKRALRKIRRWINVVHSS